MFYKYTLFELFSYNQNLVIVNSVCTEEVTSITKMCFFFRAIGTLKDIHMYGTNFIRKLLLDYYQFF